MTRDVWCFDPGQTIGVFMSEHKIHAQISYDEFPHWMIARSYGVLPEAIVVEQTNIYDRRAGMARKNLLPTIEVQGFIVMLAQYYGVPTTYQWNRDKNQVSDDKLEELGILMRPKTKWRHANDAARHYVYWSARREKK